MSFFFFFWKWSFNSDQLVLLDTVFNAQPLFVCLDVILAVFKPCWLFFKDAYVITFIGWLNCIVTKKDLFLWPVCVGPCCSGFRWQLDDRSHNPLLGVQFRSFCFVSACFFFFYQTCFCAAVFPSAGGTTLLAAVLVGSRKLFGAPATCQTHSRVLIR